MNCVQGVPEKRPLVRRDPISKMALELKLSTIRKMALELKLSLKMV